jgi:predicted phosphodiesterase
MRYLILADIHANLDALNAVLERVKKERIDKYIILGDVLDYGAEPNETIEVLRKLSPQEAVRGDHEKIFTGELSEEYFDPEVLRCSRWTKEHLTKESAAYIKSLPGGPRIIDDTFEIVHGSYPDEDMYILDSEILITSFKCLKTTLGFFGHTHVPVIFIQKGSGKNEMAGFRGSEKVFHLADGERCLINPGSVGQPRDNNPDAGFAVFDNIAKTVTMYRIQYDKDSAAKKIMDAGLPDFFAQRLIAGK